MTTIAGLPGRLPARVRRCPGPPLAPHVGDQRHLGNVSESLSLFFVVRKRIKLSSRSPDKGVRDKVAADSFTAVLHDFRCVSTDVQAAESDDFSPSVRLGREWRRQKAGVQCRKRPFPCDLSVLPSVKRNENRTREPRMPQKRVAYMYHPRRNSVLQMRE